MLVAEQVGTLAAIAQGRFILQCGIGDGAEQFDAMGANLKHRPSAFEEGLDAVRRLLAGETVRSHGRYHFDNARIAPRPPESRRGVDRSDRRARRRPGRAAGRRLARLAGAPPGARPGARRVLPGALPRTRPRAERRGRPPRHLRRESRADVEATAGPVLARGYRGFDPAALVTGTIDEVVRSFRDLGTMGYTDVIVRHLIDDQPKVLESLRRLEQVRLALRA